MPTSFFTGTIIETATGDLKTQWYNACRQASWWMDKIDLLDYYHVYMPERPDLAEPYIQAITEMGERSPSHAYLLDLVKT